MTVVGTAEVYIVGKDKLTGTLEKGAQTATNHVAEAGERSAGRFKKAFKNAFGSMSQSFGPAFAPLQEIYEKFEGISEQAHGMQGKVGKSLLVTGGTATAVGVMVQQWGDKDKISQGQLKTAIEQTGGSWEEYEKKTEEAIKTGEKYGHTAVETQDALKSVALRTGDAGAGYKNLELITNLAAAKHMSLAAAGDVVGKIMNGNTRVLKQYGITTDDLSKATHNSRQDQLLHARATLEDKEAADKNIIATSKSKDARNKARADLIKLKAAVKENSAEMKASVTPHDKASAALKLLSTRMHGQADVAAETFTGKMNKVKVSVEDVAAQVGQKIGPALTAAGPALMGFGAIVESGIGGKLKMAGKAIKEFNVFSKLAGAATKVWTGIQIVFNAVMDANPITLVIIAIGLLIGGIVIAYMKFKPFHDLVNAIGKTIGKVFKQGADLAVAAFKWLVGAFETAWHTIGNIVKKYGIIILALVAPFVGIPLLVIKHWKQIVTFMGTAWKQISSKVSDGVAAVVRFVSNMASSIWGWFTKLFSTVRSKVSDGLSNIVTFWSGLPGRIVKTLSGLSGALWNVFSSAVTNIKTKVTGYFSGAAGWLVSAGKNIIQGLLSGAGSLLSTIGDFFLSKVPSALKGPLKKALGIHSPSTVFAGYGKNIMEGLMLGLNGQTGNVSQTMNAIMGNLARTSVFTPAAAAGVGGAGGRVINLFPGSTVDMNRAANADLIIQRLEIMIAGSRL